MALHLMAFIFYTLAMLGIFFVAFVVYKKFSLTTGKSYASKLKIEDMLSISQRKSLYVIKYDNEKFLIAADLDNTTLLAKLNSDEIPVAADNKGDEKTEIENKIFNINNQMAKNTSNYQGGNVMRNILKELNSRKEF